MKIIGHTPKGDLIIQVSQAEWDGLGDGVRPRHQYFRDTEVYRRLKREKLMGLNWLSLTNLFNDGCIDGTVTQLKEAIANQESYLYRLPLSQKSLDKIYTLLTAQTKEKQ